MDKVKLEHYVPRFYLRNFTVDTDGKTLYCLDKEAKRKFPTSIEKMACEKYFYDISLVDQTVEKKLAKMESDLVSVYNKLVNMKDLEKLNIDEISALANFIVIQELRTREWREWIRDLCEQLKQRLSRGKLSEKMEKELSRINTKEYYKEFQIRLLARAREFAEILIGMKWILAENKTSMLFYTSDHPISRHNPIENPPFGNLGLLCRGIQIFFPLTPKLAICMCDLAEYFTYPDRMSIDNVDNVVFQNYLQVQYSNRFVFSQDADFALAEKILCERPHVGDPKRRRVSVT